MANRPDPTQPEEDTFDDDSVRGLAEDEADTEDEFDEDEFSDENEDEE